jgi:hypothetical protein
MSTHTVNPIRGSTASSALPPPRTAQTGGHTAPVGGHPRHTLGSALHAAGVFLDTAFRVVVLGSDGTPDRGPGIPRQGRPQRPVPPKSGD